jgi:hypothetical protein
MKTWNRIFQTVLGFVLVAALGASAIAQIGRVNNYSTSTFTASWSTIYGNGGAAITGAIDDGYGTTATIPFAFNFDSTAYAANTTMYISGNGSVGWSATACCDYNDEVGDANIPNAVCLFACDLYTTTGIYYMTTGSAPSRVYTVEYVNWGPYGRSYNQNMQVKLYETTNVIEVIFINHNANIGAPADGNGGGTGLNSKTSPSFVFLRGAGTSSIQTSTPSTDVRFTPPVVIPPTQLSLLPKSLNYGAVGAGSSLTLYDTAYCLGPNSLKLNGWTINGSNNFTVVSGPAVGSSIAAGQYAVFGIQFAPTLSGNLNATFTLVTTGRDSGTQQCSLNGIGAAAGVTYTFPYNGAYPPNTLFHHVARRLGDSATQWFYVTSSGVAALNFTSIYMTGLQASMYTIIHVPPNPMVSGLTDSIGIRFKPWLEGRPDAALIINTNAINNPSDSVSMWGVGVLAHLVITPSHGTGNTLAFDSVAIGDSVCQSLTLHNTGSDTLTITKQVVTYGDYDFAFYPLTGTDLVLAPDASKIVNVCFKPITRGGRFASIRFYTSIPKTYPDNRDTSEFTINVTGTGVPYGILSVAGPTSTSALLDSTKCITVTLTNAGLSDLTDTSVTLTGAGAPDFTLTITPAPPFTLSAGASMPVTVCFTAKTRGPESVTLLVSGKSSGRVLSQSLSIVGTGLTACTQAAPNIVSFGSVALPGMTPVNTQSDTCVTVTNCGDTTLTYAASIPPGTNYQVIAPSTQQIAPGKTGTFCITFGPTATGVAPGSLIISTILTTPDTLPLMGVGAGVMIAGSGAAKLTQVSLCDTFTVTVQNTGNIPWTPGLGAIATGTYSADFKAIGTTNPSPIPAGGSGTIQVSFCPSISGSETADLTFPNAVPVPFSGTVTLNGNGTSAGVTERTEQNGFSLGASYPNPTNGKADVLVTLPREAKVAIVLIDARGATVGTAYTGNLGMGDHVVTLDASALPSGTYFYTLTSGDVRLTREMIVGR